MEFLKAILGDELYGTVKEKVDAYNGNESNADKVKLANLAGGEYVSKMKYDDIISQMTAKQTELDGANGLIAELKKTEKGNEELQAKISGYETQVSELEAELNEAKVKSALKVALLSEKATDIDYLTYKLEEKLKADGKTLELDDNENIKGIDDLMSGLKTQFSTQFETAGAGKVDVFDLEKGQSTKAITKAEFDKMGYKAKVELKANSPELYSSLKEGR